MLEPLARSALAALTRGVLSGCLTAAALGAGAAEAAQLVDVRVGRHPEFVRVVFETDAPAEFVMEAGEPGESRVRIEAGAPETISVPPGAGAEVTLEALPGGGTLARIRAAAPVRVESQVLDRPPRIVFDLRPGAAEEPVAAAEPDGAPTVLAPEIEEPSILPDLARPLAESPELAMPGAEPEPAAPPEVAEEPAGDEPPVAASPAAPAPAVEPIPEPEPIPAPQPEPPPVSAAPPAALGVRLDDRSLVLGAAGGLAVGLGLALLARGRRAPPAPPRIPPMEVAVVEEAPAPTPAAAEEPVALESAEAEPRPPLRMAPWPESEPLAADLLVMIQRLDERLAGAEQALAGFAERAERLERRSSVGAEELASQRAALARLDVALGRPLGKPDPTRATEPPPASTTPPRQS